MPSVCGCEFISMCYLEFWDSRLHEAWYKTVAVIAHPKYKLYNFLKSETTLWTEICAAGCIMNTTVKVTCCGIVTENYRIGSFVLCRRYTAITNCGSTRIMDVRQVSMFVSGVFGSAIRTKLPHRPVKHILYDWKIFDQRLWECASRSRCLVHVGVAQFMHLYISGSQCLKIACVCAYSNFNST
jgi:hypothetical protein